jgi:exodeoxyribonuclease V beta subunit
MDRLSVSTIHGFCSGVLQEFAMECGVASDLRFIDDDAEYLAAAIADEVRTRTWTRDPEWPTWLQRLYVEQVKELVQEIRGAVGAHRPTPEERIAAREALREGLRAACERLADAFNLPAAHRFVEQTRWKTKRTGETRGMMAQDVEALAEGIARFRASGVLELPEKWSSDWVGKHVTEKGEADALAFELLPLCDSVLELECEIMYVEMQLMALDVLRRMENAMQRNRVAAFNDMIALVERALADATTGPALCRSVAARYDAVVIDEFQDTDWAQWQIFSTLFGARPLILVGDPKQAIYRFRGADITAYQHARAAATADARRVHSLTTNHRSDRPLVDAVSALFRSRDPFKVPADQLRYEAVTAQRETARLDDSAARPLMLWSFNAATMKENEQLAIRRTAEEIHRLLTAPTVVAEAEDGARRRVIPSDIAVLIPEHRFAGPLQRALRRLGIAAAGSKTGDIVQSIVWRELRLVIEAVADPRDASAVRTAITTVLGGWSAEALYQLRTEETAWRRVVERIGEARDHWIRAGAVPALRALFADWRTIEQLSAHHDGERALTDLRHIMDLLPSAERDGERTPLQLLSWMQRFADDVGQGRPVRQLLLESDRAAVTITTIWAAKGLEWPIVFCPFLWSGASDRSTAFQIARFPDGRRVLTFESTLPPDALPDEVPEAEAMRLAYVALTRAKWRTYVGSLLQSPKRGAKVWEDDDPQTYPPINYLVREQPGGAAGLAEEFPALIGHVLQSVGPAAPPSAAMVGMEASPDTLAARLLRIPGERFRSWRISSYSEVTRPLKALPSEDEPDRLDDAEVTGTGPGADSALPGGANAGDAMHLLFETFDYRDVTDPVRLDAAVATVLDRFGLPTLDAPAVAREEAADVARRMVRAALEQPIPGCPRPLCEIAPERTLREWRFSMPMTDLSVSALAATLSAHGPAWLGADYARRLARVDTEAMSGYLTGIVDLVAEIDGRWWIVDWKTNTLGSTAAAYDAVGCRRAMLQEHFVLQYHLYTVALHRFLRWRCGDAYDYDTWFGGVGYAFLRGLAAGVPAWFVDRPSAELVAALDRVVGGGNR